MLSSYKILFIFIVVFQFHVVQAEFFVIFEGSLIIDSLHFRINFWGVYILQVAVTSWIVQNNTNAKRFATNYVVQFLVKIFHSF
jgi:hypothetical protein